MRGLEGSSGGRRRRRRERRTELRDVERAANLPVNDVPESVTADCLEQWECLSDLIGHAVARALQKSPSTPVRPPSHNCPPVRSQEIDIGLQPTTDYDVLAPLDPDTVILSRRLRPGHYGVLIGWAWTVAWNLGSATGNPYLSAPVSVRVNRIKHVEYKNVTLALTTSLAALAPFTIVVPPGASKNEGSLVELVAANTHATQAIRVAGRIRGYEFPVSGGAEGILGGLVPG